MVCFAKYNPLFPAGPTSDELVFLQPVEYNSYFAGACISWRRDANGGAWQPHYRITDHLGSTRLETSSNGTIIAAYDYKPFGEQIPLMTSKTRKTYIGKERDDENYLGDFGVRKYDYAAGRFTAPDVLWEKYMGWSPYQYCMNNPISKTDRNGKKIYSMNFDQNMQNSFNQTLGSIQSWNSPIANELLSKAQGAKSSVYMYMFPDARPVKGKTASNVGRPLSLESEWNSAQHAGLAAITLKSPTKGDMKADVILSKDGMLDNMGEDGTINPHALSPIFLLDELNHAVWTGTPNEKAEHLYLFKALLEEINNGTTTVPGSIKTQIEEKVKNP